jgi:hypothetical protein
MSTRFVPVVVVLPAVDYETLCGLIQALELPADLRAVLLEMGWTQESVMLGRILSVAAEAERRQR